MDIKLNALKSSFLILSLSFLYSSDWSFIGISFYLKTHLFLWVLLHYPCIFTYFLLLFIHLLCECFLFSKKGEISVSSWKGFKLRGNKHWQNMLCEKKLVSWYICKKKKNFKKIFQTSDSFVLFFSSVLYWSIKEILLKT